MKKFRRSVVYEIEAPDEETADEIWAESGPEIETVSPSFDGGITTLDEGHLEEVKTEQFRAEYRNGYYVVVDTETGATVSPPPGHYKAYRDGYLWDYAAAFAARDLNNGKEVQG